MRLLFTATCLTPIGLLLAGAAGAETTISSATSANLATATANNGAPDDLTISSSGSVTPAAGTAVTINSNNGVTNAGSISFTDVNDAIGIGAAGGFSGSITSSGTISVTESYAQTDSNGDGVVDGPFAQGGGRYGILVSTGSGAFTGAINNSGAITVKGNNSAGIEVDAPLVGSVTNTGAITVTGDGSAGIRLGAVSGSVTNTGAISATGAGTTGLSITGNVGGAVVIHSGITATGYTAITLPSSTSSLTAANLLQGGPAVQIGGNVAGGVLVALAPADTSNTTIDSDNDGLADASEGTGALTSYGSAPALQVGSASAPVELGLFNGGAAGLVVNGSISASGVYSGISATGLLVGGFTGQTATIDGGITNTGSISATANGATATAIEIGTGGSTPLLANSGTISGSSTVATGGTPRGIVIDAGGSLPSIVNSGTISVAPYQSGGATVAILDSSGTLAQITNTGKISAAGSASGQVAIDTSAGNGSLTYIQALASGSTTAPSLTGAIITGGGADMLEIAAGTVTGAASLGDGDNRIDLSGTGSLVGAVTFGAGSDTMTLADTASYAGSVDFGSGPNALTIGGGTFTGQIVTSAPDVAVTLSGGTLALTNQTTTTLASLTASGGTIGLSIDPASGAQGKLAVAGTTSITGPTIISVTLTSIVNGQASYTLLTSGTLSGSANLGLRIATLPYLLDGSLAGSDAAGTVIATISRKSAAELGFNRSETAAYDAVYADIVGNAQLSGLFSGLTDRDSLLLRYRQMLPDHAGGVFDLLSTGTRLLAPGSGNETPWARLGSLSLWAQQGYWNAHQDAIDTPGYHGNGWGLTAGGDVPLGGVGRIGVNFSYIFGDIKDTVGSAVTANQYGGGLYWLADIGRLHLSASGSAGYLSATGKRFLAATDGSALLTSIGKWHGLMLAGHAAASYEARLGAFYLRPNGTLSYERLHEGSHSDSGGGSGFDLIVDGRTSSELAVSPQLALGVQFGGHGTDPEATVLRLEVEGGRRQILSGGDGATTARFDGGEDFTLLAEDRRSATVGTFRVSVGSADFRFVASASDETRSGYHDVIGRAGLRASF